MTARGRARPGHAGRGGSARVPPESVRAPTGAVARAAAGMGVGLALGFAVWVFVVPLADVPYHTGYLGQQGYMTEVCTRAGLLWLVWAVAGMAVCSLAALMARGLSSGATRAISIAAAGVYLLACRGGWGYEGIPPSTKEAAASHLPATLPVAATVLPLTAAAGAILVLLLKVWRSRGGAPVAEPSGGSPLEIVGLHGCLSLVAAHLTLQLPYYLGARSAFLHQIGDLLLLPPWF